MERLRKSGSELVYRCAKQHSEPGSKPHGKRGPKVEEITLTPLQLIDPIAALVQAEPARTAAGEGARGGIDPLPTQAEPLQPVPPKRPAHYLWAVLIPRIYEVFTLLCPICGGGCASSLSLPTAPISAKLVDVNYPDRSATTILAGGSGE
jgi:hypothetical protein